ncbi:MAG: hypothetical protein WDA22_17600 [Bacteroidota bacterium]
MISLVGLPLLFFMFYNQLIEERIGLNSFRIDLPVNGSSAGTYPQNVMGYYQKVVVNFTKGDEPEQIKKFQKYHQNIERQYTDEQFYFEINIDKECSYNLVIQVLDVLSQDYYWIFPYKGVFYAKRITSEWRMKYALLYPKAVAYEHLTDKQEYLNLSNGQKNAIAIVLILWCALLSVEVFKIIKQYSVA